MAEDGATRETAAMRLVAAKHDATFLISAQRQSTRDECPVDPHRTHFSG